MNSGGNGLRGPGVDSDVYRMPLPRPGVSPREAFTPQHHQGRLGSWESAAPAGVARRAARDQATLSSPALVSRSRAVRMRWCAAVTAANAARTSLIAPARSAACAQPATCGRL